MKISKAVKNDNKALFNLEKDVFKNDEMAISKSSFYYHIKNNALFKVEFDGKVVAYILWLERKTYYRLYSLAVSTEYRGKGIASILLDYSIKSLAEKNMQLEVRKSNISAIKLYEKFGFKIKKELKAYYKSEDGLLMKLKR